MIDAYIGTLEESIPESSEQLSGWCELEEMCEFLDMYVSVLEQQTGLAGDWIEMIRDETHKADYTAKMQDTAEVIKAAKCISLQLQQLSANMRLKEARKNMAPAAEE
eukprot:TRINITY_DN51883_c0_g1_i1.p1 TRINITY_DN51883_c0_g1~~TRINITY_DN51883_c0_g1_i1.p1  ORF type:complete len:107 (-),score=42.98 TRINITY_DN51883_c0_g1_i1:61-381(-)